MRTKSQHRLVYLAGRLLAQESWVVALDGEQSHDACRRENILETSLSPHTLTQSS